jgi:hypothetical protein
MTAPSCDTDTRQRGNGLADPVEPFADEAVPITPTFGSQRDQRINRLKASRFRENERVER